MKTIRMIACLILTACLPVLAASDFTATFNTVAPGGDQQPKNVVAVWVTASNGTFVRTICRWAATRANDLLAWKAASGGSASDVDGVMGATRPNHTTPTPVTALWDMKNKAGVVVPDGTYNINFECTDDSGSAVRQTYTGAFVKNGIAGTRTLPGTAYFKTISIVYAPSTVVTPTNHAPVAQAQNVSLPQDTAKAITLVATDVDGNALTYAIVTSPTHGLLSGTAPSVTYTPTAGYVGADSFTFKANDGLTDSAPATVSITVTGVNHAPVAQAQSVSLLQDTAKAITLAATDADGNALTYAIVTSPTHGLLSGTAPNMTYTPTTGYAGADSFTFRATDGLTNSAPAIVSITVAALPANPKTLTVASARGIVSLGTTTVNSGSLVQEYIVNSPY